MYSSKTTPLADENLKLDNVRSAYNSKISDATICSENIVLDPSQSTRSL